MRVLRNFFVFLSIASLTLTSCSSPQNTPPGEPFGISLENAARLEVVATYGQGLALEIGLPKAGDLLAVRSTIGLHLYDTQTWEPRELNGPRRFASQMVVSPDGSLLALAIPDANQIELWSLPDAGLLRQIPMPEGHAATLGLRFSPNGEALVGSSLAGLDVWRTADGVLLHSFTPPEGTQFRASSISGDGSLLAAPLAGEALSTVMVWELAGDGSAREHRLGDGTRFDGGQFAPDGESYAALVNTGHPGQSDKLFVWRSLADAAAIQIAGPSPISAFAWVPALDGHRLVTGHSNGDVSLWDAQGALLNTFYSHKLGAAQLLQVDATGGRLAVAYQNGSIALWSLPDGALLWVAEPAAGEAPVQIALHFDGARLFGVLPSGRVRIWDMGSGAEIGLLEKLTTGEVLDLTFSPDGKELAAGLENGLVRLWNLQASTDTVMLLDQGTRVDSVAFGPDARRLAAGVGGFISELSYDDTVRVWDWPDRRILQRFAGEKEDVPGCSVFRNRVAFSPDGGLLASLSHDFSVSLWDTQAQVLANTLRGHTQPVLDMDMSADGGALVTASLDGTIRLWRMRDGAEARVFDGDQLGMLSTAISPDGGLVAGGSVVGVISVWDAATGRLVRTLAGDMNNSSMIAFSPDGSLIAAGKGGSLLLWSTESGDLVAALSGAGGNIVSVAFSPDGRMLAFGSESGLVHVWRAP